MVGGAVAVVAYGLTYLLPERYSAKVVLMPPQQQSGSVAAALQSLGGLAGLVGVAGTSKNPADQYVSMLQTDIVARRVIEKYKLKTVYGLSTLDQAVVEFKSNLQIGAPKKDGFITVHFEDVDPIRAATVANNFAAELQWFLNKVAGTEAKQRRIFFERQLGVASEALSKSELELQQSGISEGSIRVEPSVMAEELIALKSKIMLAELSVEGLRHTMTEQAQEYKVANNSLVALKKRLLQIEGGRNSDVRDGYVEKYRAYKYNEKIFELMAKQYEIAKVDESSEGTLVQIIDNAEPPKKPASPRRILIALMLALLCMVSFVMLLVVNDLLERNKKEALA